LLKTDVTQRKTIKQCSEIILPLNIETKRFFINGKIKKDNTNKKTPFHKSPKLEIEDAPKIEKRNHNTKNNKIV
jgi:hypothetical protein